MSYRFNVKKYIKKIISYIVTRVYCVIIFYFQGNYKLQEIKNN
ncbi:hypothetical protein CLG_B0020 [Clostridium botulinum D str. 1873]|uniref:Uncharacterized protein n=1 Tax=Clostridium botulinum D str. 1873 TaxID=592027 RepID=A0A9P2G5P8_CLOBO|nr:hypothetical protein CLG_B0020 [Clostridium botulinum D str. 1873]